MKRKAKDPEARKREFLDTAERLFNARGYENTSVDDIVARMAVAKGLFYYYFKSKEDLLGLIIDRIIGLNVAAVDAVASRNDLGAIEKLRELFKVGSALRGRSRELTIYFHKESNRHLHSDIEAKTVRLMAPALARIIRQGVDEGIFETAYPDEAALAIFAVSSILGHEVYQRPDAGLLKRRLDAALHFLERLLGAAPGTLDFYKTSALDGPQLRKWLARIRKQGGVRDGRGARGKGGKWPK